ncbi:uncharacterized protein LOC135148264 [Daucus carota subsp. sativus]|uniref:uncharacterized protein LOC135148264 n=1 Tax=Daucus carota subsp. sativus TaxID=79200 RepID=UPI003083C3B4
MESSGAVAAKFCLKITRRDVSSNSLTLPNAFYSKYSNRLVGHVELNLRSGYVLPLRLDYNTGVLNGFLVFFMELELKGGEFMLFEYFGRYNFNVYLLGTNGTEIDYPHTVHYMQRRLPRAVNVACGGWRFVKLQTEFDSNLDEITPTPAFLERCAVLLPDRITYIISNGKKFHGSYCHNAERFTGLRSLCDIVGVDDLSAFHMMLYEYHWQSVIKISVFDKDLNEIVFSGTPLSKDANSHCPSIGSYFAITISPKHMNEDCYTVDIPNEFSDLVNMWDK